MALPPPSVFCGKVTCANGRLRGLQGTACVCVPNWHTILTGTHATVLWHSLTIAEVRFGVDRRGTLQRWCQANGRHIKNLHLDVARALRRSVLGDVRGYDDVRTVTLCMPFGFSLSVLLPCVQRPTTGWRNAPWAHSFRSSCPACKGPRLAGAMLAGLTLSACTLCLQAEKEGKMARILLHVYQLLFTCSSKLQRLNLSMHYKPIDRCGPVSLLPRKLIKMMKLLPSLESLALAIPHNFDLSALAAAAPSLSTLKVHASGTCNSCCMNKACCWCAVPCSAPSLAGAGANVYKKSCEPDVCPSHIGGLPQL
jgi:hypothetical protein